jgi:hypothetical protein
MNGIFTVIRFVTYTVGGLTIRKGWNWLMADIDPIPGSKEFDIEYYQTKEKYIRLTKKKENYDETCREVRRADR